MSARILVYEEMIARNYQKLIRPPRKLATKLRIDGMEVSRLGGCGVVVRVQELSLVYPRWTQTGFLKQYVRNLNFVRKHFRLRWRIATKRLTEADFSELTQRLVLERMNVLAIFQPEVEMTVADLRDGHVRNIFYSFLTSKFGLDSPMVRTVASRLLGCDQVNFCRVPPAKSVSPYLRSPDTVRLRI